MKIIIWLLCFVLAALWTGLVAAAVGLTEWIAYGLASGQLEDLATWAAKWPIPEWIPAWIDPMWVQATQPALTALLEVLGDVVPYFSAAVAWLVPLMWAGWTLGILLLLLIAGAAHWSIGRIRHLSPRAP